MSNNPAMLEDGEVVNGVPVLADETREIEPERAPGALSPATGQTAAVVGASVVARAPAALSAGAALVAATAAFALGHRRPARRLARRRRRMLAPVLASRSFLVD